MSSVWKANIIIDAQNNASASLKTVQKDLQKITTEAQKTSKTMSTRAKNNEATFQSMAIGGWVALAGITAMAKKSVMAFSDYEESINAVNVMFGESAKAVQNFAQISAKEIWLSKTEFQQMSVWVGALLKNAGASTQELSDKTIDLAKRASDMASVFNTSVPDAMSALQQALRGEAEAIRRYGGDVTDATLQTYLLSQGIQQKVTDLSQAEKTMYRYDLMMQQTAVTAGDFKNTSDGLANSLRIQEAQAKNSAISIWQWLKPALDSARAVIEPLLAKIFEWINANPQLAGQIVLISWWIAWMSTVAWTLWLALPAIVAWFTAMTWPIGLASGAIAIWVSNIKYIVDNIGSIQSALSFGNLSWLNSAMAKKSASNPLAGLKWIPIKKALNTFGPLQARANGWPVNWSQPYLVGEKWPELFVPWNSWKIVPNNKMWGSNISINFWWVSINNGRDENRLMNTIEKTITKAVRQNSLWYV